MEDKAGYLRRGRRFASLTLGEANELWVSVFVDLAKGRELKARQLDSRTSVPSSWLSRPTLAWSFCSRRCGL